MSPPAETYNEDMLDHLRKDKATIGAAMNNVYKIQADGGKFTVASKNTLVGSTRLHSECSVCNSFQGNPRPEEEDA